MIALLHGQVQYFVEVCVQARIFAFAAVTPIHWNNAVVPQIYKPLNRAITNLQPTTTLYLVPANYLNGIMSIFPLKEQIQNQDTYVVIPYKFEVNL